MLLDRGGSAGFSFGIDVSKGSSGGFSILNNAVVIKF